MHNYVEAKCFPKYRWILKMVSESKTSASVEGDFCFPKYPWMKNMLKKLLKKRKIWESLTSACVEGDAVLPHTAGSTESIGLHRRRTAWCINSTVDSRTCTKCYQRAGFDRRNVDRGIHPQDTPQTTIVSVEDCFHSDPRPIFSF